MTAERQLKVVHRDCDRRQRIYATSRRVLAALIGRQMTRNELAEEIHVSRDAVLDALQFWREQGLVYVARWNGTQHVYAAGEGEDAPKPAAKTAAQKSREWRARGGDQHRTRRLKRRVSLGLFGI